jgi:hypothetical protein
MGFPTEKGVLFTRENFKVLRSFPSDTSDISFGW